MQWGSQSLDRGAIELGDGIFRDRMNLVREYIFGLKNERLLQNFRLEAGLGSWAYGQAPASLIDDLHLGWEPPTCQLRGHFLGHWLSSAAQIHALCHDSEVKAKA